MVEAGEQCDDGNSVPGDGCSGVCQIEPGYTCPIAGQSCVYSLVQVCGDGKIEGDEACDDGNKNNGDGCSSTCEVEQGYSCGAAGTACTPTKTAACGDGTVNAGEQCDDGNTTAGDGCSPTCQIEQGWTCPTPGSPCQTLEYCGDGVVQADNGEMCDDGNAKPGDGCSASCQIEPGYACPAAGQPCVQTWVCGNGHIDPGEACDDGNAVGGDGCSADCTVVEPGYTCPTSAAMVARASRRRRTCAATATSQATSNATTATRPRATAARRRARSSPATRARPPARSARGSRTAATASSTATTSATTATTSPATAAARPASSSRASRAPRRRGRPPSRSATRRVCGDGVKEGSEQCDDGNLIPYDGCSPTCTIEPTCKGGTCTAVCGDGLKFPQEQCDDGNTISGDGCSSTCTLETGTGYTCTNTTAAPPATLTIPILYRDMLYAGTMPSSTAAGRRAGPSRLPEPVLRRADGPRAVAARQRQRAGLGVEHRRLPLRRDELLLVVPRGGLRRAAGTNPFDKLVYLDASSNPTTLTLTQQGAGSNVYQFNNQTFYPLDGLGWNAGPNPQTDTDCNGTTGHNFSFTSELHYPFTYSARRPRRRSPSSGDDDVWAFINGQLVVDLGGVHSAASGSVTLDAAEASTLGLTDGGMYSIDLFQAERHTCGSTYTLTLSGFAHTIDARA